MLLDLLQYETEELNSIAFELLIRNHSQMENLLAMLDDVQILEDTQNIQSFSILKSINDDFISVAERTENWFGIEDEDVEKAEEIA